MVGSESMVMGLYTRLIHHAASMRDVKMVVITLAMSFPYICHVDLCEVVR